MSDDEVLKFEITDQDLDNEFNFGLRRPRMSKNQATYGIWADNSDDEDADARPSFSGGVGRRGAKANYMAPVGFVSAGVQRSSKEQEKDKSPDEDDGHQVSSGEEEYSGASVLGFSGRARKKKKLNNFQNDRGEIAGMRTSGYQQPMTLGKGFGDWEKHTKGIGAKLLMKMGYQSGKGLGKDLQGRATIIEAHLRKGRGAIGAYGREKSGPSKKERVDSEEEEEKDFKEKLHQWKRGGSGSQKVKYIYKTADQVLEEGKWRKVSQEKPHVGSAGVKVIDMTGKEKRVLSGYHAISAQQMPDDDVEDPAQEMRPAAFDLPELRHNIDLILDKCEEDLIGADRKMKHLKNRVEVLEEEEKKLSTIVDKERSQISSLEGLLSRIEKLEQAHDEKLLDLDTAKEQFLEMKRDFPDEYSSYEIPYIAVTIVSPLIRVDVSRWRPLDDLSESTRYIEAYKDWYDILSLGRGGSRRMTRPDPGSGEMDPFDTVLWEAWMPVVRAAVAAWNPRSHDKLISFLELWQDMLPAWMWSNILDQLVLPKLQNEVELWNPVTDSVPLHSWLHPWLPLLGQQLEIVYPTIRNKLASALTGWHPSDRSAKLILMPWKDVFPKGSLQAFVIKNILPKLEQMMHGMAINPHQQRLEEWNWVMEWIDLLSPQAMSNLLETHFFPRWLQVLATWLNHNPNYDEVTKWYKGWKSMIPSEIIAYPQIRMKFSRALEMMTRVVSASSGHPMSRQPGAPEAILYLSSLEGSGPNPKPQARLASNLSDVARTAAQMADGYKDLVARRCEERGILFAPTVPPKYREGKQIYRCGKSLIYLDRSAILAQKGDVWVPTSLNTLLDSA